MKYILDDKEYQKLQQSNVDLKKHNKVLQEKIKDLESKLQGVVEISRGEVKEEKTAKEMFNILNYTMIRKSHEVISYQHIHNEALRIDIGLMTRTVFIYRIQPTITGFDQLAYHTTVGESKAIQKQIEELGWV